MRSNVGTLLSARVYKWSFRRWLKCQYILKSLVHGDKKSPSQLSVPNGKNFLLT